MKPGSTLEGMQFYPNLNLWLTPCDFSALRSAQALGMHRDPGWGKWEEMHQIEIELRVIGWWGLIVSDR